MYYVLYNREFKSIGDSLILENWSRTQRSYDYDDLSIRGEMIPYDADPFFVVVNDRQGRQIFSGLSSVPTTREKEQKTSLSLKDYKTLWNTEIVVDWSVFSSFTNLGQYISKILELWLAQTDVGFSGISWDTEEIKNLALPEGLESPQDSTPSVESVYDLIDGACLLTDIWCDPYLDIKNKRLLYRFRKPPTNSVNIRLADLGVSDLEKSFGDINRAVVYSNDYTLLESWSLTTNNAVSRLPSVASLVYPAKQKVFIAADSTEQAKQDAIYSAVTELAGSRYQERVSIDVNAHSSVIDLSQVDLSYVVHVYSSQGFYRTLPVGEIQTDSSGKRVIVLGKQYQELTQEI